jgi:hypothetical protein
MLVCLTMNSEVVHVEFIAYKSQRKESPTYLDIFLADLAFPIKWELLCRKIERASYRVQAYISCIQHKSLKQCESGGYFLSCLDTWD